MKQGTKNLIVKAALRVGAFDVGYRDGLANRQNPSRDFWTAENLRAWFEGWKKGQLEHAAQLRGDAVPPEPRLAVITARKLKIKPATIEHDHEKRRADYLRETGRTQ